MNSRQRRLIDSFCARVSAAATPPAVVLGSSVNGLSFLRSFRRRGIPVLCADGVVSTASWSRSAPFVLLQNERQSIHSAEQEADRLFTIISDRGVRPLVFATSDSWQIYVSQRLESSACAFDAIVPDARTMSCIVDKQAQYEAAVHLGIPVPAFANASLVHQETCQWHAFPAIIKPRWAHSGRESIGGKAIRTSDSKSLHSQLERLAAIGCVDEYIVQELIPGEDHKLFAYLGCYDFQGQEFSYILKNKLRQHPPQLGDGCFEVTVQDDELANIARRLITGIGYRGLVGVEFKRSTQGYMLIEINPRTVSTNQLAITAGVDFPWHAYQLLIHRNSPEEAVRAIVPRDRVGRAGVYHMHEERDLQSLPLRRRTGELTIREWLRCLRRAESFAIWSPRDPWPLLRTGLSLFTRRFAKVFRQDKRPQSGRDPQSSRPPFHGSASTGSSTATGQSG